MERTDEKSKLGESWTFERYHLKDASRMQVMKSSRHTHPQLE